MEASKVMSEMGASPFRGKFLRDYVCSEAVAKKLANSKPRADDVQAVTARAYARAIVALGSVNDEAAMLRSSPEVALPRAAPSSSSHMGHHQVVKAGTAVPPSPDEDLPFHDLLLFAPGHGQLVETVPAQPRYVPPPITPSPPPSRYWSVRMWCRLCVVIGNVQNLIDKSIILLSIAFGGTVLARPGWMLRLIYDLSSTVPWYLQFVLASCVGEFGPTGASSPSIISSCPPCQCDVSGNITTIRVHAPIMEHQQQGDNATVGTIILCFIGWLVFRH